MKLTRGEKVFGIVNIVALTLMGLATLYPFVYTLSISLSTATEANRTSLHLYPREVSLAAYRLVLGNPDVITAYVNTLLRTILGTFMTLFTTCLAAYPLSRKELPRRGMIIFLILFTMIFDGGIVPRYLLIRNLGLMNSIWALVLPTMLTAFNIIVIKNFFQQIPESLGESARIDGASEASILFRIYIPLSLPVLATVALWTAVLHWNQWFDAMLYISDDSRQVLQTLLQRVVIENSTQMIEIGAARTADIAKFTPETVKAATVIVTILPILLFYPFVQRFFVKGIMLGGVKE